MIKRTLTATAIIAALAVPAYAQTATPPAGSNMPAASGNTNMNANTATTGMQRPTNFVQSQQASEWRGSQLIGASVYGSNDASIGEINDVVFNSQGQISAVVVGVGGFLGIGEKDVAVPFQALNVTRKANSADIERITVAHTKETLTSAPAYAYYETNRSTTTGTGAATTPRTPAGAPANPAGTPSTTPSAPAR